MHVLEKMQKGFYLINDTDIKPKNQPLNLIRRNITRTCLDPESIKVSRSDDETIPLKDNRRLVRSLLDKGLIEKETNKNVIPYGDRWFRDIYKLKEVEMR
jgi:hypothetical protein